MNPVHRDRIRRARRLDPMDRCDFHFNAGCHHLVPHRSTRKHHRANAFMQRAAQIPTPATGKKT